MKPVAFVLLCLACELCHSSPTPEHIPDTCPNPQPAHFTSALHLQGVGIWKNMKGLGGVLVSEEGSRPNLVIE